MVAVGGGATFLFFFSFFPCAAAELAAASSASRFFCAMDLNYETGMVQISTFTIKHVCTARAVLAESFRMTTSGVTFNSPCCPAFPAQVQRLHLHQHPRQSSAVSAAVRFPLVFFSCPHGIIFPRRPFHPALRQRLSVIPLRIRRPAPLPLSFPLSPRFQLYGQREGQGRDP